MIKKNLSSIMHIFCAGIIIFLFFSSYCYAQGPGMPADPGYDPDKEVPLDGGIGFLLAAGLAYGIKKIKHNGYGNRHN